MMSLDQLKERIDSLRRSPHCNRIGDDPPCAQDVVGAFGPVCRNDIVEDDVRRFCDLKLSAFDKVRELGFKEGE
jgi:hypothetical protein